jgi:hypothetical protein
MHLTCVLHLFVHMHANNALETASGKLRLPRLLLLLLHIIIYISVTKEACHFFHARTTLKLHTNFVGNVNLWPAQLPNPNRSWEKLLVFFLVKMVKPCMVVRAVWKGTNPLYILNYPRALTPCHENVPCSMVNGHARLRWFDSLL